MTDVTVPGDWNGDGSKDLPELIRLYYDDLHRMARQFLRREWRGLSLGSTSVLHETYLRLAAQKRADWKERSHFFGIAALLMRRLIEDYVRSRLRLKRKGDKVPLDDNALIPPGRDHQLIDLCDGLRDLERTHPELVEIVDLRFWAGFKMRIIGELLGVSRYEVEKRWKEAREWFRDYLRGDEGAVR